VKGINDEASLCVHYSIFSSHSLSLSLSLSLCKDSSYLLCTKSEHLTISQHTKTLTTISVTLTAVHVHPRRIQSPHFSHWYPISVFQGEVSQKASHKHFTFIHTALHSNNLTTIQCILLFGALKELFKLHPEVFISLSFQANLTSVSLFIDACNKSFLKTECLDFTRIQQT
jgi:hypothetical protein